MSHVCRYTYTAMLEVQHMIDTTWIMSPRPVVPWGLRKALNWVKLKPRSHKALTRCNKPRQNLTLLLLRKVKEHYADVPIYVMANGVQEDPARFKDSLRVYYLYNYINEALKGEKCCSRCFLTKQRPFKTRPFPPWPLWSLIFRQYLGH